MERPIIFNTENIKAILDGRKIMTRRVVKDPRRQSRERDAFLSSSSGKPSIGDIQAEAEMDLKPNFTCPYGQVGDRLWVRENFFYGGGDYDNRTCNIRYAVDNVEIKYRIPDGFSWDKTCKWCYTKLDGSHPIRPSLFMPRWASRLTLEITGLRAERLQEITIVDCIAEGIKASQSTFVREEFEKLWDSLNAKRGYGWETNPWVWVIKFDNIGVRMK